jgi:transcriptional regulator with XRE-family HTH domain
LKRNADRPLSRARHLRLRAGHTLSEVANTLGVAVSVLSEVEALKRAPSKRIAAALSRLYREPISKLLAAVK